MMDFKELLDWKTLLFVSVVTSVVVEFVKTFTPEWIKGKAILPVIALIITMSRMGSQPKTYEEWQSFVVLVAFTMSFAGLFYNYLGEWTVVKLFAYVKESINKIFGKKDEQ